MPQSIWSRKFEAADVTLLEFCAASQGNPSTPFSICFAKRISPLQQDEGHFWRVERWKPVQHHCMQFGINLHWFSQGVFYIWDLAREISRWSKELLIRTEWQINTPISSGKTQRGDQVVAVVIPSPPSNMIYSSALPSSWFSKGHRPKSWISSLIWRAVSKYQHVLRPGEQLFHKSETCPGQQQGFHRPQELQELTPFVYSP